MLSFEGNTFLRGLVSSRCLLWWYVADNYFEIGRFERSVCTVNLWDYVGLLIDCRFT